MKKRFKTVISVYVIILSFAACGQTEPASTEVLTETEPLTTTEHITESETESAASTEKITETEIITEDFETEENPGEFITIGGEQYPVDSTELNKIWCDSDEVIQEVSKMKNLVSLGIIIETENPDFTPLSELSGLTDLKINSAGDMVIDISSVTELANITSLSYYNRCDEDFSLFGEMSNLTNLTLYVSGHAVDLKPLSKLKNLTSLSIFWFWGENDIDISPLTSLDALENLTLHGSLISNCYLAEEMPNLKNFYYTSVQNFFGIEDRADEFVTSWSRES
jgi:hypothetical protein